jgi:hypothetical protein
MLNLVDFNNIPKFLAFFGFCTDNFLILLSAFLAYDNKD